MKKQRIKNVLKHILNQSHLKMKITFLFVFLSIVQGYANNSYGQNQRVTLKENNVRLIKIFQQIEDQTALNFFYNRRDLNMRQKVSVNADNTQIVDVLGQLFNENNISYEIIGNQIVLKKGISANVTDIKKQEREIVGTVLDENSLPLVGVTVIVEGTNKGVVTDFDGNFKIKLEDGEDVLVFSTLGYKSVRIVVGDQTVIPVVMKEDLAQLEEIVLIGYGTQKREAVTGAVSSVTNNDMVQLSNGVVGIDRALGGLAKGVQVSQGTGRPGAPIRINVRGFTSPLSSDFGGTNQPLFVIDGVPFNTDGSSRSINPLSTISPYDIESVNILKDAAATSIYGSRGANGVILIKTKGGKKNTAPKFSFNYSTSVATPINTLKSLDAAQYRSYYDKLISGSVTAMNEFRLDPFFAFDLMNIGDVQLDFNTFEVSYNGLLDSYFGDADTDWNDEVFRSIAITNQANFNTRGGSENTTYSFSLSGVDQDGLSIKDKYKQYNLNMALNTDVNKYVRFGGTANFGYTNATGGDQSINEGSTINTAVAKARPDLPVRDALGNLLGQSDFQYGFETLEPNPVMQLENRAKEKSFNFIGNVFLEVEPLKDLKLKADVNAAVFDNKRSLFTPKIAQTDFVFFPSTSLLNTGSSNVVNYISTLTADYNFSVNKHNMGVLVGASWERSKAASSDYFYTGFPDDEELNNASSAEELLGYSENENETGLNSLLSRFTYSYDGIYNATFNFRSDASSKFGPENKRAYFPSLSASVNFANMEWLRGSDKVSNLKLRASIGRVGSTNVGNFSYLQFFLANPSNQYNAQTGIVASDNFPNENIGWETTEEINLGLDFALFNSRLRASIDVYDRTTEGALVLSPIPLELGPDRYYSNLIDVSNKGVEVSLGGDIVKSDDFSWSMDINWATNKNELLKLKGSNINTFQQDYYIEGEPVGTIKGYEVEKIIQTPDEIAALNADSPVGFYDQFSTGVGDYMFKDTNGDGRISSADRTILGDIEPDYFGGFSTRVNYKNLSLSGLFQYSVGGKRIWNALVNEPFNALGANKLAEYGLNTWTPTNTDARYAQAIYFDPSQNQRLNDRYLFSTSYLRLKSVQLAYNFNQTILDKLSLEKFAITLSGANLLTWTKWPGLDPETFSERGGITDAVSSEDPYPLAKSFSLGIQLQF